MIRNRQAGMGFIFVTLFLDVMGFGLVIPVTPALIGSFMPGDAGETARSYGYFIALYAAMQFVFAPVLGGLSDQYGRRPLLLISLFGAGVDLLMMSFAPTLWLLFVGRFIAGTTAASVTVANAYIADVSPPEKRAQNFGLVGVAFGLGFVFGPAIGGVLGSFGPRVPFMVAGCLTLLNWLYGFFVLPESLTRDNRRVFAWRQANPMASVGSLRRSGVLTLVIVLLCGQFAQQALATVWVLSNAYRFSWNTTQQGVSLAVTGVGVALVQAVLVGFLVKRLGERRVLVFGAVAGVVSFVLYGFATAGWMMYAILTVQVLGFVASPAAQGLISNQVGDDEQGAIQGAITSLMSLLEVLAPPVAAVVFAYSTAPDRTVKLPGATFFLGAVLNAVALLLALYALPRKATAASATP
jgi:MFS transporter, DHA1 family, tetracycline resistance protein